MKKILLLAYVLVMPLVMVAQEKVITKNLPDFTKVELSGKLNVKFVHSSANSFDMKLNGIDSNKLSWGVKKGQLYVKLNGSSKDAYVDITIYYTRIEELVAMLSKVEFEKNVKFDMLEVKLVSGAQVNFDGTVGDLMLRVTGNSKANLSGKCDYFSVSTIHSQVRAGDFEVIAAWVSAATKAEVVVNADERLEINATSGSTVFYKGKPMYMRIKNTLNPKDNIVPINQNKR